MPVAQLTLEIRIEHARSLKDRRQVVRSLKNQLRQGVNASVAGMDEGKTRQSAAGGALAEKSVAAGVQCFRCGDGRGHDLAVGDDRHRGNLAVAGLSAWN